MTEKQAYAAFKRERALVTAMNKLMKAPSISAGTKTALRIELTTAIYRTEVARQLAVKLAREADERGTEPNPFKESR